MPSEGVPGVPLGSLVKLKKTVYGLGDGPLKWFQCLLNFCLSIGFRQSPFDPCLLTLFEGKKLGGVLGLTVDDIIGGGDDGFNARCDELRKRFPFGKWESRGGRYAGRDLTQLRSGAIIVEQKHLAESLKSIPVPRGRRDRPELAVTPLELSEARAQLGNLAYHARESRVDVAGPTALLQSRVANLVMGDLLEINRVIALGFRFRDSELRILPFPPD